MSRKIEYSIGIVALCISAKTVAAPGFTITEKEAVIPSKQAPVVNAQPARVDDVMDYNPGSLSLELLDTLAKSIPVAIDDPEGGEIILTLRSLQRVSGNQVLKVTTSSGNPGVITRRGNRYYATIATRRGTYALSHAFGNTQLFSQEQLNLRIIPGLKDYALPPE